MAATSLLVEVAAVLEAMVNLEEAPEHRLFVVRTESHLPKPAGVGRARIILLGQAATTTTITGGVAGKALALRLPECVVADIDISVVERVVRLRLADVVDANSTGIALLSGATLRLEAAATTSAITRARPASFPIVA